VTGAGQALQAAAIEALAGLPGLNGAYPGEPLQGAFPYALVEVGPELDWSHKGGKGRDVRLAAIVRDAGERPDRLQALGAAAEAALEAIGPVQGWALASFAFLRSRCVREGKGRWAMVIEFRARMLAQGE